MRQRNVKNLQTTIKQKLNQHTNKIWINTKKATMQPGNQQTNRTTNNKQKKTHARKNKKHKKHAKKKDKAKEHETK